MLHNNHAKHHSNETDMGNEGTIYVAMEQDYLKDNFHCTALDKQRSHDGLKTKPSNMENLYRVIKKSLCT
jgi:hypothetical protein